MPVVSTVWKGWWWVVEGKTVWARAAEAAAHFPAFIASVAFIAASPKITPAISSSAARDPEARSLSLSQSAVSLVFGTCSSGEPIRARVEAGERMLFEIDGLAVSAISIEMARGVWGGRITAGLLTSPVGRETVLGVALLGGGTAKIRFAVEAAHESVSLQGCRSENALSLSFDAVVRAWPDAALCSRIENVRLLGIELPGANASFHVIAFPQRAFCALAGVSIARDGALACEFSARVSLARRIRAAVGYNEAASAIDGSLAVGIHSVEIQAGASLHPALGVSKSFFASWTFGGGEP